MRLIKQTYLYIWFQLELQSTSSNLGKGRSKGVGSIMLEVDCIPFRFNKHYVTLANMTQNRICYECKSIQLCDPNSGTSIHWITICNTQSKQSLNTANLFYNDKPWTCTLNTIWRIYPLLTSKLGYPHTYKNTFIRKSSVVPASQPTIIIKHEELQQCEAPNPNHETTVRECG